MEVLTVGRTGAPVRRIGLVTGICWLLLCAGASGSLFDLHTDVLAQYDFAYSANAGVGDPPGPASELNNTPFYIVDGANSGLTAGNPNVLFGPRVHDLSGNDYDLFHEFGINGTFLPSSSDHPRYVTSQVANGGSGDEGVYQAASGPVPTSSHLFEVGNFVRGFTLDVDIEVDRMTAPSLESSFVHLPGIFLAMNSATPATDGVAGGAIATIEGTFGTKVVASTTSLLKTGATRPQFNLKLIYLPFLPSPLDNLFLLVNDVVEDSRRAPGITAANGVPLALTTSDNLTVLGNGFSSRVLTGVVLTNLTVAVPEPTSASLAMVAFALYALRQRQRTPASNG